MNAITISISIDQALLEQMDMYVQHKVFLDRNQVVQTALRDVMTRLARRQRLARECARLNPALEQAMAEEGLAEELSEWPPY